MAAATSVCFTIPTGPTGASVKGSVCQGNTCVGDKAACYLSAGVSLDHCCATHRLLSQHLWPGAFAAVRSSLPVPLLLPRWLSLSLWALVAICAFQ